VTNPNNRLLKGVLFLSLAQGAFLLAGYIIHAFLARWLAPSLYGVFGVAIAVLGWAEIAVNNGVPSALQKFLPDDGLSQRTVRRSAARSQAVISVGVFLMLFLAAPWLAALLRDPNLTAYLRLAFLDILAMGAYGYYRGVLNGWRAFPQLTVTLVAYSLTKLLAICLLVFLGFGVQGALIGNVIGSLGGLAIGLFWTRRQATGSQIARTESNLDARGKDSGSRRSVEVRRTVHEREILVFIVPTVLFTLASNVLLGLDLMGVKAVLGDPDQVGYYVAAANLANAPRLALLAFSFVLLPSLSHAIAARDRDQARHYLQQIVHLLALVLLPILALVTATAESLVILVFSAAYRPAGAILTVLAFTYAAYTIYITLMTVLLAENRPGRALTIPVTLLPIAVCLVWLGINRFGVLGAAFASLLSVACAAAVVTGYVLRRYKPAVDGRFLARLALAAAVVWGLARLWAPSGLMLILAYGLLAGLYVVLLLVMGLIKPKDIAMVKTWFSPPREGKGV
jgi:O-antigen/teichoic acid export membrane protein